MSAVTPQSYVDDGVSFTKRTPHDLSKHRVAKWISSGSNTSAYTGSFIDDGADMQLRDDSTPGFGQVDKRFYKQKKAREPKPGDETVWNEHVQKAVTGDMQRNLDKMRGLGGVQIKKRHGDCGDDGDGDEEVGAEKQQTVTVSVPPQWGTILVRADDGRVIVVEKDGEFDSGSLLEIGNERPKPWVIAASTVVQPSSTGISISSPLPKHQVPDCTPKDHAKDRSDRKAKTQKHKTSQHSPLQVLTTIPESEYEDGYLPATEPVGSLTNFLMTGGASGWPSRTSTCMASPAMSVRGGVEYIGIEPQIRAIREGYRHVRPNARGKTGSSGYEYEQTSVDEKSVTALEQSWNGGQVANAWEGHKASHAHGSRLSHRRSSSGKSRHEKKGSDDVSMKSYSTYKAPTVEDAPNISSSEDSAATGWRGGCKKSSSSKSSSTTNKPNESAWNVPHPHTWAVDGKAPSEQSWDSRPKAADNPSWTRIQPSASPHQHVHSPTTSPARPRTEATWDGFERLKTLSDVSVIGSGSDRESRDSRNWSQFSIQPPSTHKSRSSHKNSTTWEADQVRWAGSQASKRSQPKSHRSKDWSESQAKDWNDRKATTGDGGGWDADSATKYANGFDEDNKTYLNASWGGMPVRVGRWAGSGSPRKDVVQGWD